MWTRQRGLRPDAVPFNATISALEKARRWRRALALLRGMRAASPLAVPTIVSCSAAISACEKGGAWRQALRLLGAMRGEYGVAPSAISYNACIAACGAGGRPELAAAVLRAMPAGAANSVSYSASIISFARTGRWARATELFGEMEVRV